MKDKKALREFAKTTYYCLQNTDNIEVIKAIKTMIFPIYELIDKEVADGLGYDLFLWVGLKENALRLSEDPKMAYEYGEGIMQDYGEYLK